MHTPDTLRTDKSLQRQARRRVAMKTGWMIHAAVYLLVNVGLFVINQAVGGRPWHVFPLAGWGLGLAIHGIVVALVLTSAGWHGRMVDREMARLQR